MLLLKASMVGRLVDSTNIPTTSVAGICRRFMRSTATVWGKMGSVHACTLFLVGTIDTTTVLYVVLLYCQYQYTVVNSTILRSTVYEVSGDRQQRTTKNRKRRWLAEESRYKTLQVLLILLL